MPRSLVRLLPGSRAGARLGPRALPALCALVLLAAACTPDATAPTPAVDPSQLYWALTVDHHAVTLSTHAPYDTLRLTATPRTSSGAVLSGAPTPRFRSTDVERVQVDSAGVLHAIKVGTGVVVLAVDTVDDIVHVDTVIVNVTSANPPPVLDSLSIHPLPPDSAKSALYGADIFGDEKVLAAWATDADGNPIDGLAVSYTSSDPLVATIDHDGVITTHRVGTVTFIASATAYGITRADTLLFTVGLPLYVLVDIQTQQIAGGQTIAVFPPGPAVIGVGGDVVWHNSTSVPVDVTFDDPTNVAQDDFLCAIAGSLSPESFCSAGNVAAWSTVGDLVLDWRVRQFPVAGTYHYHSTLYGTTGTIIVQ